MYDPRNESKFGLTEREKLWDKVSHKRFVEILNQDDIEVTGINEDYNDYGEFMFVSLTNFSSIRYGAPETIVFYGLGYHENADKYLVDTWEFYDSSSDKNPRKMNKSSAISKINSRKREIEQEAKDYKQGERGQMFDLLSEMSDDDGATTFMDDLGI